MSQTPRPVVVSSFEPPHVSVRNYVVGFVSCLLLTLLAFDAVVGHWFNRRATLVFIAVLAVIQAAIQLRRFLHVGQESKPRWRLLVFILMLGIVLLLIVGSLWIITSLNSRMMLTPEQQNQYMQSQDGL